jgi:RNA polymerase sigma-70 factor, ECF subfamily
MSEVASRSDLPNKQTGSHGQHPDRDPRHDVDGVGAQTRLGVADLSAAFERRVLPLRESLYRHAFRMSRNHDDAEDLLQETMLKAYRGFDSFRPGTNLDAWLHRIMINTCINGYHKKRRQPVHYSIEEFTDQSLAAAYAHCAPMALRSAEDLALDSLPDNDLKTAVQALPWQFRTVVYYADVEGRTCKEIAAIMKTPPGTVMSRLCRGRRQLRRLLVTSANRFREPRDNAGYGITPLSQSATG